MKNEASPAWEHPAEKTAGYADTSTEEGGVAARMASRIKALLFRAPGKPPISYDAPQATGAPSGESMSEPHRPSAQVSEETIERALCPYLRFVNERARIFAQLGLPEDDPGNSLPIDRIMRGFDALRDRELAKHRLTPRETEVAKLILEGDSTRHIARTLFITESGVRFHVSNILRKIGGHSRRDLFMIVRLGMEGDAMMERCEIPLSRSDRERGLPQQAPSVRG